jgi:hypothetical protein
MNNKMLFIDSVLAKSILISSTLLCAIGQNTALSASMIPDHIVIEKMTHCYAAPEIGPSHVIFDQHTNKLGGWSHIIKYPDDFSGLTFDSNAYRIDSSNVITDNICQSLSVYETILVKKYADWDKQHANGLLSTFDNEDITLGDIKDIVIELKINSEKINIPDKQSYLSAYSPYTDTSNLLEMDQGMVNLGITLYGEHDADQSIETFNGMINLELNQYESADHWLRIVIPAESLNYFLQKDYTNTETDPTVHLADKIVGIRLNPETRNTKVLRNYIQDDFTDSIPESYKEIGISIRQMSVRLNEDNQFWWGDNPLYPKPIEGANCFTDGATGFAASYGED